MEAVIAPSVAMRDWKCDWCGHSKRLNTHKECIKRPDYHDWNEYTAWMNNPDRPTREGKKYMRPLDEWEQMKLQEYELDTIDP